MALSCWHKYGKAQVYVQKKVLQKGPGIKKQVSKSITAKKKLGRRRIRTQYLRFSKPPINSILSINSQKIFHHKTWKNNLYHFLNISLTTSPYLKTPTSKKNFVPMEITCILHYLEKCKSAPIRIYNLSSTSCIKMKPMNFSIHRDNWTIVEAPYSSSYIPLNLSFWMPHTFFHCRNDTPW